LQRSQSLLHRQLAAFSTSQQRHQARPTNFGLIAIVMFAVVLVLCLQRLFKYISGDNVGHVKIPMTAPVTVKVTAAQGPFCEDNFTVSFFVPFEHQVHGTACVLRL